MAKIRQQNVCKESKVKSSVSGERSHVDISSVRVPSVCGNKFWALIVDDFTDMCWSIFMKAKLMLAGLVVLLITKLRSKQRYPIKHVVKVIRCNDAGENKALETLCVKYFLYCAVLTRLHHCCTYSDANLFLCYQL
jgi:hypothetical protein